MVEEEELREALKEKGLGTPATRAATIETLLRRKYIERERKNVVATDLGRYLVAIIRDSNLTSPELTGQWESKLNHIEKGESSATHFMSEIADYTRGIIRSCDHATIDHEKLGNCPCCGKHVIAGKQAFGCSGWRDGCKFVLKPTHKETELKMTQIRELLQHGVTGKPITLADGREYLLRLAESGVIVEIPVPQGDEQNTGKTTQTRSKKETVKQKRGKRKQEGQSSLEFGVCPLCGANVVEQTKSYSCSGWREGCKLTIWKTISGKKISASMAKKIDQIRKDRAAKRFQIKSRKKVQRQTHSERRKG